MSTSEHAARTAGITYRQLDHWVRCGYLTAAGGEGTGHPRDFGQAEIEVAKKMARMVAVGIRPEAAHAAARNDGDLGGGVIVLVLNAGDDEVHGA